MRWRTFRAFPVLGQMFIWFVVALCALLGLGFAGAIAAAPKPAATVPAVRSADPIPPTTTTTTQATSTTAVSTTTTTTTAPAPAIVVPVLPVTTVVEVVPATPVPETDAVVLLTATIVDGDTIHISDGSTVRLIGIDTPERGQCGYHEASAALAELIGARNVTLVPGARDDTDRYGRLLRYVEVDGVDVDLKMIESGRAIARYDGRDGYGVHPRQDAYVQADDVSPSANLCTVIAPVTTSAAAPAAAAVYYQNCSAVRAAGAAPIRAGDPGWQSKFDADGDGVGCE
jgi:micrococcal nuclease